MGFSPAAKVGFVTVVSFALLGATVVWLTRYQVRKTGYPLTLEYGDVNGLAAGAAVMVMGVRVGRVLEIHPGDEGVTVRALIERDDVKLFEGSRFKIYSAGLIGDKVLEIFPPPKDRRGARIQPEARLRGDDPVRLDTTFEAADQAVKSIRRYAESPEARKTFQEGLKAVQGTFAKVDSLTTHLDELVLEADAFVSHGRNLAGTVRQEDVRVMVGDLKVLTAGLRQSYQALLGSPDQRNAAQEAIDNLAQLSARLSATAGQIEAFTSDPKLKSDLQDIVKQTQSLLTSIRGPEGKTVPGLSPRLALIGNSRTVGLKAEDPNISGDLGMRVNVGESALLIGVEDIGLESKFTATWGLPHFFADNFGFHVGMIRTGLGAGIDWSPLAGVELGAEAYNDQKPKARLTATLFPDFLARRFGLNIELIQSQALPNTPDYYSSLRAGIQWRPMD
ncbi:MAG: MCE family protein [Candidatus Sericytochromatia bacterium]|nr:MCE family protein [Candidatus Tanganyikabacteria bacterium]